MTTPSRRLLLAAALAVAACGLAAPPASAGEDCASCHEEVSKAFVKTPHGQASRTGGKAPAAASCASCHAGADAHAVSGGEKKTVSLRKGKAASVACLSCHEGTPRQAHWQGSAHDRASVSCASCHSVHGEAGRASRQALPGPTEVTKRCLECHGSLRVALHQRSSHPLKDGLMDCASCHDPHGGAGEKLLKKASVNELCYSCHQNMRGPFLWEHSPVREDCLTCHKAHGSSYPQILQARVTQLCQSCHQQGRHQTIPGVPSSIWVDNKACLNCHQQIHGSNHPSGPLFQR